MNNGILQIHPDDDLIVALADQPAGTTIQFGSQQLVLARRIPAKHKFAIRSFAAGDPVRMYGITVGRAAIPIASGELITTENLTHATDEVVTKQHDAKWASPDVSRWSDRSFLGYRRDDQRVGVANYWIVLPLVFCENRNLRAIRSALLEELGYSDEDTYRPYTRHLLKLVESGASAEEILAEQFEAATPSDAAKRIFPHVDGVKFLSHDGGCGGLYDDARTLCGLLAGYINHPNVAGATVLSLGCQKSQIGMLEQELHRRNSNFKKPLYIFDQQKLGTEQTLLTEAVKHTIAGLTMANSNRRAPAGLEHLSLGVECGGSDGFSGISANPAIGHCSDLLVALGGTVILSEFPELAGCEQDLTDRCKSPDSAERFIKLMHEYARLAEAAGGGFDSNPSPGNIREGLITDAMKSAGAAKKGGSSPVVDVLDYPEWTTKRGLNLLCTPGGDVESTTAMAGAGATVQIFSTGLGTPTGNAVSPVIKVSSNRELAERMPDIIDLDAGSIIHGTETVEQVGERLLEMVIELASGHYLTKAQRLGQDDFIPWKRGITF